MMSLNQKLQHSITIIKSFRLSIPIFLLIESILAYGLLAPALGFYFDDWPVLFATKSGINLWDFYAYDRPFSAWTYILTNPILGTNALGWHLFTILLRWLTTWGAWWVLKQIWPTRQTEVLWICMLFAVHPAFVQLPIAVAYSQHFIVFALYFLSIGSMVSAIKNQQRFFLLTATAVAAQIIHVFTMEYFWGLELVRPLFIWILLSNHNIVKDRLFLKVVKFWAPYLLILGVATAWRQVMILPIDDPNDLRWLSALMETPVPAIMQFVETIIKDFVFLTITTWYKTIQVNLFDISSFFLISTWAVSVLASGITFGLLHAFNHSEKTESVQKGDPWFRQASVLSIAIFLLGTFPVWITNKQITVGKYSDRFALAGMFGASILIVLLLNIIVFRRKYIILLVSIFVGLATGSHLRVANEYRWDWIYQQRFFWQFHWRVPDLEPGTAIFSDGAIFNYTGEYPTAFAINLLLSDGNLSSEQAYWFIELDQEYYYYQKNFLKGYGLKESLRNISFEGRSTESLVINYEPETGSCLVILEQDDEYKTSIPELTRSALSMSDLSRIMPNPQTLRTSLDPAIFGEEIEHRWCYYFQKAELAKQLGDWEQVAAFGDEARKKKFEPQNRFEWKPFIQGYLKTGNWQAASEITLNAYEGNAEVNAMFCRIWESHIEQETYDAASLEIANVVISGLACNDVE
ncbi:MAG: hypothetical protein IZT55_00105 [Anaerolineae bacterium]|nr:hypothetical protein [Anaerolineae bacterium]